jgi:hypothetical protein
MEKVFAFGLFVFAIVGLAFVRRWKNNDPDAGLGVAGWGLFLAAILAHDLFVK